MAKKSEVIDITPLVITKPALYEVEIKGMDSIIFNRFMMDSEKTPENDKAKENPTDREWRIWRDKAYITEQGNLYIPSENIHECLKEGSKYWGQKIPGEGNKTYTDVIASALICENIDLGATKEELLAFDKQVNGNPSKGKKSGAKVLRVRPLLRPWGGTFRMHVFDSRLSLDVLRIVLSYAGTFRGLGDWRPIYGRFELVSIKKID